MECVAATEEEILERALSLRPVLRERAAQAELSRRLPEETYRAFQEAGFFKIMQPRRYGGLELDFGVQTALGIELGRACGSSAWVATLLACHAWIGGMFPGTAQEEIWGRNPNAVIATSFLSERTDVARAPGGGWRLSGRWKMSSGVDYCDWIILLASVPGPDHSHSLFCLLPRSDWRVEDTWFATGLAGTGSNDVIVDDALIPDHRTLDAGSLKGGPTPGSEVNDGYLYRQPLYGTFSFNLVGNAIGLARGVAEAIVDGLRQQTAVTGGQVAANQSIQLRVAEALAEIDAAYALVFRNRAEVVRDGKAGQVPDLETRARYRRDNGFATQLCVRAVNRLCPIQGARGLSADNPVQRAWRDIHAVAQHIALTWDIQGTLHGTVALGLPCPDPRL